MALRIGREEAKVLNDVSVIPLHLFNQIFNLM